MEKKNYDNKKNNNDDNNKNIFNINLKKKNENDQMKKYIFYTPDGVGFNIDLKKN